MRLSVFRTASVLRTLSPVIGQMPPLASVAAIMLPDSHVTSMAHNYEKQKIKSDGAFNLAFDLTMEKMSTGPT